MEHFLEEAVAKRDRRIEETVYWTATALMLFTGLVALLNVVALFRMQNIVMNLLAIVMMGAMAVYLYVCRDKLRPEYEYTFLDGQLEFALVLNNKKRKTLGRMNVEKAKAFGRVQGDAFRGYASGEEVRQLCWFLNREEEKLYYFAFSKNGGKSLVIFEPSEEMVGMIKRYLPCGVYQEN